MTFRSAVVFCGLATLFASSAVAARRDGADDAGPRIAARNLIEHQRNGRKHVARTATRIREPLGASHQ